MEVALQPVPNTTNIYFASNNELLHNRVNSIMEQISSKPCGLRLIEKIGNGRHPIIISFVKGHSGCKRHDTEAAKQRKVGCSTTIYLKHFSFNELVKGLIEGCRNSYGKGTTYDSEICGGLGLVKPKITLPNILYEHELLPREDMEYVNRILKQRYKPSVDLILAIAQVYANFYQNIIIQTEK